MSPKRRGTVDDRWERTGGGLFVPRRPTLPTRRYVVGKLGGIKCCCEPEECQVFTGTPPDAVSVTTSGATDGDCVCTGINDTYEPTKGEFSEIVEGVCSWAYRIAGGLYSGGCSVTFTINQLYDWRSVLVSVFDLGGSCSLYTYPQMRYGLQEAGVTTPFGPGTYTLNADVSGNCPVTGEAEVTIS